MSPTSPTSPCEEVRRPAVTRKVSGLDYEEELAIPMPKPRRSRGGDTERNSIPEDEKDELEKPPSFTGVSGRSVSPSCSSTATESKKMSKFQILKSKISFKDLKKEVANDELPYSVSIPKTAGNIKPFVRRPLNNATTMPSIASAALSARKTANVEEGCLTRKESVSNRLPSSSNASVPSRIPLPPLNTSTHPQEVVSANADIGQRCLSGERPPSYSSSNASKEDKSDSSKIEMSVGTPSPDTTRSGWLDVLSSRPGSDSSKPSNVPLSPDLREYPATDESPPLPDDLLEGDGKVKYIPKTWLEDPSPLTPAALKIKESAGPASRGAQPRNGRVPSRVPTLKERFEKPKLPSDDSMNTQSHGRFLQDDEIVEMVRSVKRHTDTRIDELAKKLEKTNDQLSRRLHSIADLSRTVSEILIMQSQMAREMKDFQQSIRLQVNNMERHINGFETQVVMELREEVRALARSYEELNAKTDTLVQNTSPDVTKRYMEVQDMRDSDIETEIAYHKSQAQRDFALAAPQFPAVSHTSVSSIGRTALSTKSAASPAKPKSKQMTVNAGVLAISAMHPPMLPPRAPIAASTSCVKTPSTTETDASETKVRTSEDKFPRSVSLTKKGFAKGITSTTPGQKEKTSTNDESRKWSLFRFRRRNTPSESNPTNNAKQRSISTPEPARKQFESPDDKKGTSSTGSSTPPMPAIPIKFPTPTGDKSRISMRPVHPALRSAEPTRPTSPNRPPPPRPRPSPIDLSSTNGEGSFSAQSTTTEAHSFTTTTCSSVGGMPLSNTMDMDACLNSVPETEPQTEESDDISEDKPLLGGDDGGNEWSYVSRSETQASGSAT